MDEIGLLRLRVRQLREVAEWLQAQVDSVELEVNRTVSSLVEERDSLRWRVDPFSGEGDSLADSSEI